MKEVFIVLLKILPGEFSVVQVPNLNTIDFSVSPIFIGRTEDELSVVLPTEYVPNETVNRADHWRAFKIEAVLDFGLVGILAKISTLLAEKSISIFAISTFNTDYLLVKTADFEGAKNLLRNNGYELAL